MNPPTPLNIDTSRLESHSLSSLHLVEVQGYLVCESLAEQQNEELS